MHEGISLPVGVPPVAINDDELAVPTFEDEERRRTASSVRIVCLLGILSFASYYLLDPFVSDNIESLYTARAFIIGVTALVAISSYTRTAQRHYWVLALAGCFVIGGGVIILTLLAGGATTRYHEALLITMLGYPVIVPMRPLHSGLAFAALAVIYGAVMTWFRATGPMSIWLSNNAMLWASAVIATAGSTVTYGQRRSAFYARETIAKTSADLARALDDVSVQKDHAEYLLAQVGTMRAERLTWLENLARFLRHELSNQIVAVATSMQLAQSSGSLEDNRLYLDRGERSLRRMRGLVSSATEATSLEAALAVEETTQVDWSGMIDDRLALLRAQRLRRSISSSVMSGLWVEANEARLSQVLDKLLDNAIAHSAPGGEIRVVLVRQGSEVELRVENTGDPLSIDKDRMFEAFVSTRKSADNLGMGLFVARSITEDHGGKIYAEDLPDMRGARFVVRLPSSRRAPGTRP